MKNVGAIFTYSGYDVMVDGSGRFYCEEIDNRYETAQQVKQAIDNQIKYKAKVAKKAISLAVVDGNGVCRTLTGIHASRDKFLVKPNFEGPSHNEPNLYPDVEWVRGALKTAADLHKQARQLEKVVDEFVLDTPTSWGRGAYSGKTIDEKYDVLLKEYDKAKAAAEGTSLEAELKKPRKE